jgi:hypothetical protein
MKGKSLMKAATYLGVGTMVTLFAAVPAVNATFAECDSRSFCEQLAFDLPHSHQRTPSPGPRLTSLTIAASTSLSPWSLTLDLARWRI